MELTEIESEIPGCFIFDTFYPSKIIRTYASFSDYTKITLENLHNICRRIVEILGPLKSDPFEPLLKKGGFIRLLTKRILADLKLADLKRTSQVNPNEKERYVKELKAEQLENGSWDNNPVTTAFNLIRLHELDVPVNDGEVKNAIHWLLDYPEPRTNLPGLWMSQDLSNLDDSSKARTGMGRDQYLAKYPKEFWEEVKGSFRNNADLMLTSCDMVFFDLSAIVLEALLRYKQQDHKRVIQAINTIFEFSNRERKKITGCRSINLDEELEPKETVDFDDFYIIPADYKNSRKTTSRYLPWFTTAREALRIYPRRYLSGTRYSNCGAGDDKTIPALVKADSVGGLCFLHIHRAFSFHPDYAGSNLETIGAFHTNALQNSLGQFFGGGANVLSHLAYFSHPVAAATVLKSIPLLIHEQCKDGLFETYVASMHRMKDYYKSNPQHHNYTREIVTYIVLKALHKFGFLELIMQN